MLYWFSLSAGLIITTAFLFLRAKGASVNNLFLKAASSLCFILTSVFALILNPDSVFYGTMLIMGGVLGLVGDIALDLKYIYAKDADRFLNAGFVSFLIGHIFYSTAVILQYQITAGVKLIVLCAAAAMAISSATVFTSKKMNVNYGKFKGIVLIYGIFLTFTAVTSVCIAFMTHSKSSILFAAGAILFMLSDVVLNFTYFGRGWNKPIHIFINHLLYYAGQFLIASSILFLK